jgi:hypothetical protein
MCLIFLHEYSLLHYINPNTLKDNHINKVALFMRSDDYY